MKKNFFAKILLEKCQISKSSWGPYAPYPLPTPMVR